MHVDNLIIGQGISGTFLSYFLWKEGHSFLVIDNVQKNSPSRVAAGVINPVTGRRMVKVWLDEEVLPFAKHAYAEIGSELGFQPLLERNIIDFFPNPFMKENFLKRRNEDDTYLQICDEEESYSQFFNFEFGCGMIRPVYLANPSRVVTSWREKLIQWNAVKEEDFKIEELEYTNEIIRYGDITAERIFFCDGTGGAESPLFGKLPFAPNKGEALILRIPDLPDTNIYKKSVLLAPLNEPGIFWAGSNYAWEFEDDKPTAAFRESTERQLKEWLKPSFKIEDHVAGVRPATLERRPFVGMHPHHPRVGILNGMGTKGCSLAPYFAKQLVDQLMGRREINPLANINRFTKVLNPFTN